MKYLYNFILLSSFLYSCSEDKKDDTETSIPPLAAVYDPVLATKGEELFKKKCYSCHRENEKLIGPAMRGVTQRREPEWIMRMILEPEVMLKEDPIAIKLLEEHGGSPMSNMHLSEYEARAVYEYLRKLAN